MPDLASAALRRFFFLGFALGHGLAHLGHLAPDALELGQDGIDGLAILLEMAPALIGRVIELLGPVGLDPGIAQLFQICQRRIDHPRAGHVIAARALLQPLDQLIAMAGLLGQEMEQQELQIRGAQLAAPAEALVVEARAAREAPAGEAAAGGPEAPAAAVAAHPKVPLDIPLLLAAAPVAAVGVGTVVVVTMMHITLRLCVVRCILRYVLRQFKHFLWMRSGSARASPCMEGIRR